MQTDRPSKGEAKLPDYLIIGAQKAGTTWLWQMFRKHPLIRIPPKKEIHFFDREILSKSYGWYKEQLADPNGNAKVTGEKTPCYAHLKLNTIRLIHELKPDVKLILFLRRPIDRSWSQARMEVSRYNRLELSKKDEWRCVFQTGLLRNSCRTDYRRIIENWRAVFPSEQIFIGFYDEICSDPQKLFSKICKFLGVGVPADMEAGMARERIWKSPELEMSTAARWYLTMRYRNTVTWVANNFAEAAHWEKDSQMGRIRFRDKATVILIAYFATIPHNFAYLIYRLLRNLRIGYRIGRLRLLHRRR